MKGENSHSPCRGFLAQWLEHPSVSQVTFVWSPAGPSCVFRLNQLSVLLSLSEKGENLSLDSCSIDNSFFLSGIGCADITSANVQSLPPSDILYQGGRSVTINCLQGYETNGGGSSFSAICHDNGSWSGLLDCVGQSHWEAMSLSLSFNQKIKVFLRMSALILKTEFRIIMSFGSCWARPFYEAHSAATDTPWTGVKSAGIGSEGWDSWPKVGSK